MIIDTWINDELVTVDTEDVWGEVFAHWDSRVPTETAAAIATATVQVLERCHSEPCHACNQPYPCGCDWNESPAEYGPRDLSGGAKRADCFD